MMTQNSKKIKGWEICFTTVTENASKYLASIKINEEIWRKWQFVKFLLLKTEVSQRLEKRNVAQIKDKEFPKLQS